MLVLNKKKKNRKTRNFEKIDKKAKKQNKIEHCPLVTMTALADGFKKLTTNKEKQGNESHNRYNSHFILLMFFHYISITIFLTLAQGICG